MANFLIQPGTLLIIIVTGLVLLGLVGWAEDSFAESKNRSLQKQNAAIECSSLKVDFVDRESNSTHETVYLQVNRQVEALLVEFKGSDNATRLIKNVGKNSVVKVSAPVKQVSSVSARVKGCGRVFG